MRAGYILNGRYKIVRSIGSGGMANVYEAYDLILGRKVTVKMLRMDLSDDPAAIRRFKREALSLTELENPHIVSIYDIGEVDGNQYLVMEYVDGMDLKQYIRKNFPLGYERVIEIMEQVLDAVKEAHKHNIIHRDLKPQNILIDKKGNVKITDFGIAVVTAETTMTRTNTLLGSIHYISPEQARGKLVTKQSDIYSLGIILFELLTGRVPYQGKSAVSIALKHYSGKMPSVRSFDPKIPQSLGNIVLHATAKDPHERYNDVAEMAADLKSSLDPDRIHEKKWHFDQDNQAFDEDQDEDTQIIPEVINSPEYSELEKTKEVPNLSKFEGIRNQEKQVAASLTDSERRRRGSLKRREIIIGAVILAVVVTVVAIFAIITTPRVITVPDVSGMTQTEAKRTLKEDKLNVGKVLQRESDHYYQGQVIKTDPGKEVKTRQDTDVNLVVSSGPVQRTFGSYVGQDYKKVKKDLNRKGVTVYRRSAYSSKYALGEIIGQSIKPKQKVAFKQSTVLFTVSRGQKQSRLRDLKNYNLKSVQDYAEDLGLKLIVQRRPVSGISAGTVISQSPAAGTSVQRGMQLTVVLAEKSKSSASKSSSNGTVRFNVGVTVPYDSTKKTNKVQVYLADSNHKFSDVYKTLTIDKDTKVNIPYVLKQSDTGKFKVVRDGKTLFENDNVRKTAP